jgi:hypothetical protein
MDDLFRFLLLRPAEVTPQDDIKVLGPTFVDGGVTFTAARDAARNFVGKKLLLLSTDELAFAPTAMAVINALGTGSVRARSIVALIKEMTGETPRAVVANPRFDAEAEQLANSLVAMKLLSNSYGGDAPGLAKVAQGYDAIRLAASGRDPISLRVLALPDFDAQARPRDLPPNEEPPKTNPPPNDLTNIHKVIDNLDAAIATLGTLPASGFHTAAATYRSDEAARVARLDTRLAALEKADDKPQKIFASASPPSSVSRPWMLSAGAISSLPRDIKSTIVDAGIDLHTQSLPMVLDALHEQKRQQLMSLESATIQDQGMLSRVGGSFFTVAANDYVGSPATGLPAGAGSIRPIGIGDLLLVKQHVLRYEGGDLAHVENVLKSEHLSRDTRRLERTETTILQETETTKEEQRDTQTTDRFSLKRETSDTIKTDSSFKAGISVDAKYGPFVEVKANADFATSTATESATKQASEFSKDVVARSASKLVERVLERRSVTTISEFEEKYSHGFDNTQGAGHISGFYQWIDKVMQAQVYNYGKRMLFDVTVPEPGTNFILAQTTAKDQGQTLVKPPPFTLTADQINEGNYNVWGHRYDVTGLEPPPPPVKTVSKGFDATVPQDPHEASKSDTLPIDDGYRAKYVLFERGGWGWDGDERHWRVLIGSNSIDAWANSGYFNMHGEIGSVAYASEARQMELMAATVEIFCERTERAFAAWQLKTHAAITGGYLAKEQAYEQALAQARAAAGTVIAGRNPLFNLRLVANELRKQCLTLVTAQQFTAFGALELSTEGYAQPNLPRTGSQMPYVRFFEQAFEWEHIIYFFYPYFWGWKPGWKNRMLLDDVDPLFGGFLRAGAARVVFPVRPGFEAAVIHYLETGEIWNGGPPPDISSSLYVPIIKEIQEATGAPGDEVPVGDPWLVHLPTTLVRLRPNDDLPAWQKVGEDWQPTN